METRAYGSIKRFNESLEIIRSEEKNVGLIVSH